MIEPFIRQQDNLGSQSDLLRRTMTMHNLLQLGSFGFVQL